MLRFHDSSSTLRAEVPLRGQTVAARRPHWVGMNRRRRRLLTRTVPLGGVAVVAFAAGIVSATGPERAERRMVTTYLRAWAHRDYGGMYNLLDSESRASHSLAQFHSAV